MLSTAQAAEGCIPTTSVTDEGTLVVDARAAGDADEGTLVFDYYAWDHYLCSDPTNIGWVGHFIPVPDCDLSVWTYYETNGIDGLQRGDVIRDDTCRGAIQSDTIPF